ncbi:hypothetical protein SAMN05443661_10131 [Natronobacterium gregoryi]|uniref:Uncharacterized protein n=2 Tax=Natronobacterium gregoryi TaxID=44930 RepID=L0AM88_NATGS|nr:hypothetical protein Natgr_3011 [Natronobacterium gregoryi SP2]SFI50281.1 hypothetical protein SAMN05443661_10131 [Natronobacterium gregoryi]
MAKEFDGPHLFGVVGVRIGEGADVTQSGLGWNT